MREQADRVEEAFSRRVAETEEATRSLEAELKQVRYKWLFANKTRPAWAGFKTAEEGRTKIM